MDVRKGNSRISLEITITKKHHGILINHAQSRFPNESCALLFGTEKSGTATVTDIFLAENIERSPVNFTIANDELLRAYREAEQKNLDVVGIFHSHPHSEAFPSATDKKFMGINPVVWVISDKKGELKAYVLDSKVMQVPVRIV